MNYIVTNKWWVYQRERFPVFAHAPLLLSFSFSAISYSALLRGNIEWPDAKAIVVAFFSSLFFFLQLRIADEFKDCEEDARYRPYRPVPRGLVTLRELGMLGVMSALTQLALAVFLQPSLVVLLVLAWIYLALMSVEFLAREWLKARPITYLWTHMLIVPIVDYYATACDWMANEHAPPTGLLWFLLVSFTNGIVIEVGRKLRAPADEETGVQTYTVLWGRTTAVGVWLSAMFATVAFAVLAAMNIAFVWPVAAILTIVLLAAVVIAVRFLQQPESKRAQLLEAMSGLWTLVLYLSLGAIPLLVKLGGLP